MLRADNDRKVNARGEEAWLGVLTWVEPEAEVKGKGVRLVSTTVDLYQFFLLNRDM